MSGFDQGQAHSRLIMSCNNETSKNEYAKHIYIVVHNGKEK